jgi:hypothetical protein
MSSLPAIAPGVSAALFSGHRCFAKPACVNNAWPRMDEKLAITGVIALNAATHRDTIHFSVADLSQACEPGLSQVSRQRNRRWFLSSMDTSSADPHRLVTMVDSPQEARTSHDPVSTCVAYFSMRSLLIGKSPGIASVSRRFAGAWISYIVRHNSE